MDKRGFTLAEILVVVIIVAILAALAIPRYIRSVEMGRAREARVNLQLIQTAQNLYRLDHGHYFPDASLSSGILWGDVNCTVCGTPHHYIDQSALSGQYFTYSITSSGPDSFTARADRNAANAPPGYDTKWITIDENGTFTDNY